MKKILFLVMALFGLFLLDNATQTYGMQMSADEVADRDKCIAKGEEAVKLIKEVGNEAALKKIQDYDGGFTWDKGFVFIIDEKGKMLANPAFRHFVGGECLNMKDADGKFYFREIIRIAKTKGRGRVPCNKHDKKRDCYVLKVPNGNLIVVSILGPQGY